MKAYSDFAVLYDELMNDIDYEKWFHYIESIFKEYNKSPKTILEMACGTGNLTEFFCKAKYKVTCFDLSEDMLTVAYEKLGNYKNVKVLRQDMTNLSLGKNKFDVVVSACDSINYITDSEDLLKVFKNAYDHLEEGGLFIFDINSYYKLRNIIGENIFIQDTDDIFYVWDNEFIEEEDICNFYLTFFVKEDDNYNRFDETHKERAYKNEEIVGKLQKANFKNINMYDGFNFSEVTHDSERVFFVGVKES